MSLHVALSHLYSPSLVNSWALCLSVPLKKSMLGCTTCCKVKYHGWIFECIFVYKTGRPSWMNLLVGPLAVGTPWSTDDLPPGATRATGLCPLAWRRGGCRACANRCYGTQGEHQTSGPRLKVISGSCWNFVERCWKKKKSESNCFYFVWWTIVTWCERVL